MVEEIDDKFQIAAFKVVFTKLLNSEEINHVISGSREEDENKSLFEIGNLSLRELTLLANAKNHTEKTVVVAYYLLKKKKIQKLNYRYILSEFDKAMFVKPQNIRDILNKLIVRGLLEETEHVDELKGYKLTLSGVNFVEKLLASSKNN